MHQKIFTLILATGILSHTYAQYFETGVFLGGGIYSGDLSHKIIHLNESHPAVGIFVATPLNNYLHMQVSTKFTTLTGNDDNATKPAFQARNLDFTSKLFEAGLVFDFFVMGFNPLRNKYFSPYLLAGINYFHFNPTTEFNGEVYELQPLGTEGQGTSAFPEREPYKLHEISVPVGAGIKYAVTNRINIGLELVANKTFTDYLDDVSTTYVDAATLVAENGVMSFELSNRTDEYLQSEPLPYDETHPRGNPEYKDWYGFMGITISYNFIPEKYRNQGAANIGCPEF